MLENENLIQDIAEDEESAEALAEPQGPKVRITLEYDGTNYFGWQRQPGMPTIQQAVEDGLSRLFDSPISVISSGRTDQGVHALAQVAHFVAPRDIGRYKIVHAAQALIPKDIVITDAYEVDPSFHAQFKTLSKTYCYRFLNRPVPSAIHNRYSLWVSRPMDIEALNEAAKFLIGEHDFASFRSKGTYTRSTVRRIYHAEFIRKGEFVEFRINGSGFLKQMVRNIVGTLLDITWERRHPSSLTELIEAKDRRQAGMAVPPQGLFLEQVFYPPEFNAPLDKSTRSL